MESIKELRRKCQKNAIAEKKHLFVVSFFRIFSIYITRLFINTKITPNQITVVSTLIIVLAPLLFLLNDYRWTLLGLFIYLLAYIMDYCDGELARYRGIDGKYGVWFFEPATHDIQYALIGPVMGFAAYLQTGSFLMIILGFAASLGKLMYRILELRYKEMVVFSKLDKPLSKEETQKEEKAEKEIKRNIYGKVYDSLFTAPAYMVFVVASALLNRFEIFVWFYGLTLPLVYLALLVRMYFKVNAFLSRQ